MMNLRAFGIPLLLLAACLPVHASQIAPPLADELPSAGQS